MRVRSLGWEDPLERAWQPTPVFLPGESHGRKRLEGYSPQSCRESDPTEAIQQARTQALPVRGAKERLEIWRGRTRLAPVSYFWECHPSNAASPLQVLFLLVAELNTASSFPTPTLLCLPQRYQLSCLAPSPQRPGSQVNELPKSQT